MIVRAREAVKLTQEELARALKTNKQTISAIESDAGHVTVKMLGRVARALNRVLEIRIVVAE
jgi:transcriptional regulator with XRE-family HTH domain